MRGSLTSPETRWSIRVEFTQSKSRRTTKVRFTGAEPVPLLGCRELTTGKIRRHPKIEQNTQNPVLSNIKKWSGGAGLWYSTGNEHRTRSGTMQGMAQCREVQYWTGHGTVLGVVQYWTGHSTVLGVVQYRIWVQCWTGRSAGHIMLLGTVPGTVKCWVRDSTARGTAHSTVLCPVLYSVLFCAHCLAE